VSNWLRLLDPEAQPASMRGCHELLEGLFAALREPAPEFAAGALRTDQRARLGYLIAAARMVAGASIHPSWSALEARLRQEVGASGDNDLVLLACDERANSCDELAHAWGLRKGVDSLTLVQLAQHGAA
jgi:hypothetical protein